MFQKTQSEAKKNVNMRLTLNSSRCHCTPSHHAPL